MPRILFVIGLGFWRQGLTLHWAGLEVAGGPPASAFQMLDYRREYTWSFPWLPGFAL